jgi:hypothetical protein
MSDQPIAEACTYTGQHNIDTKDKHPCPERDSKPRSRATKQLQTYALDHAATGISHYDSTQDYIQNTLLRYNSDYILKYLVTMDCSSKNTFIIT